MRVENGVDWLCGRDENSVVKREGVSYYTRTAAFTIFWWVVSVTVIIANKYILSTLGFRFPFFITFIANLVILIGAFLLTRFKIANADPVSQDQLWLLLYPAGALTSLQIGLDNLSLVYLSVSVHVVFQSLTPLVQLLVGILCGLEHWQRQTAFALLGAGVGMALSIFGESETGGGAGLSFMGVAAVLVSMLTSTLRSVMQQAMVQGAQDSGVTAASNKNGTHRLKRRLAALTETRLSPLTVLLYKSPMCVAVSGVISLLFESRAMYNFDYSETPGGALILCLTVVGAAIFLMLLSEYAVLRLTSALSLGILAIVKSAVFTIGAAALIFGERLQPISWFGFAVICISVFVFQRVRVKEMHRLPMTAEDSGYESLALTDKDDRDDSFDNSSTELFEDHLPQTPCIPLDDTVSAGSSLDAILVTGGYAPPATMARSRTLSGSTNWVRNSPQPTNAETLTVELSSHS